MPIRPLLAFTIEDTSKLKYPLYVSPKMDGLRCIVEDGVAYSRSGKPFRSPVVQALFSSGRFDNLDGELIYGDMFAKDVFSKSTSACMSKTWPEELDPTQLKFYVFDEVPNGNNPEEMLKPYSERLVSIAQRLDGVAEFDNIPVYMVVQTKVDNEEQLLAIESSLLTRGAEGVMGRSISGRYKPGRSTEKDGIIGKLKRFSQSECVVIGFQEKMHNTNEQKRDEFGYAERSTSKEGLVAAATLGALLVKDCVSGVEFGIGSGFDDKLRKEIWENKESWLGRIVKYQYFATGMKDETMAPRFPTFKGERSKDDM